jgi:hypothetical protein
MKTFLKFLIISSSIGIFLFWGCEKENSPKWSGFVKGHIVATFQCDKTDSLTGQYAGSQAKRGFFILPEGNRYKNKNGEWPSYIYTFDLPDSLFHFPPEMLRKGHDINNCGPVFFPDSLTSKYEIRFRFHPSEEKVRFVCGPCLYEELSFPWSQFVQVTVKDVTTVPQ